MIADANNRRSGQLYPVIRQDWNGWMLIVCGLLVLFLHAAGYAWLWLPTDQPAVSEVKPFKLEVSLLTEPGQKSPLPSAEQTPTEPESKPKPAPRSAPAKSAGKAPTQQQAPDWAAVEQLIKAQPRKLVSRRVASRPGSSQSVASAIIQGKTGGPEVRDNFQDSELRNPSPEYPEEDIFLGYQGTAAVLIQVNAKGYSEGVKVLRGTGHKTLDNSAVKALKQWRFTQTAHGGPVIILVSYAIYN